MAANTAIAWTDHSFNPWWGCTKVGPGCDHCYAAVFDHRLRRDNWGFGKPRHYVSDATWREPVKWNKAAALAGTPEEGL